MTSRKDLEDLVAKLYTHVKEYGEALEDKGRIDAALEVATGTGATVKNMPNFLAARDVAVADAAKELAAIRATTKEMLTTTAKWARGQ